MAQVTDATDATAGSLAEPGAGGGLRDRVHAVDAVLVVAVLIAIVLRVWHLSGPSLWYDEWVTHEDVTKRLAHMLIVSVPQNEGSPPLYFLAGWLWVRIFGAGDTALRSLSAVIGVATVPVVYFLVLELRLRRTIARIAAFFVAVNPLLVWYSQEARPYALLALLGAVSLLCCVRAINDPRRVTFVVWGVAAAAVLCTHYFGFAIILPEALWLWLATRPPRKLMGWGCLPLAVVAIPLGLLALAQQGSNQSWIQGYPLELRFAEAGRSALLGPAEPFGDVVWPVLAVLVAVAIFLVVRFGSDDERRVATVMGLLGVTGYALALAATVVGNDYFLGRNLITSFVPFFVIVAIGFGTSRWPRIGIALAVLVCMGWTAAVVQAGRQDNLQKADWKAVARIVADGPRDRAVVVDSYLGYPMLGYVDGSRALKGAKRVDVDALDLVFRIPAPGPRCGRWSGLGCEAFLWSELSKPLERQFTFTGRHQVAGFVINHYRAKQHVQVSRRALLQEISERGSFVMLPDEDLRTYGRDRPARDRSG
jgi:hypothetical protein